MKPVKYDAMLPKAEVLLYVVMNDRGTIRKEHQAVTLQQMVLEQESHKSDKGIFHTDCSNCILLIVSLYMNYCIFNELLLFRVIGITFFFLIFC